MSLNEIIPEEEMRKDNVHIRNPVIRVVLVILGTLSVALGVIGAVLPVLPTTPFLLLAAALYARSSKRFYNWLLNNRLFGSYIRNYREGNGIPAKVKVFVICLLWLTIGSSAIFAIQNNYIRVLLFLIAIGVTAHLVAIKTKR